MAAGRADVPRGGDGAGARCTRRLLLPGGLLLGSTAALAATLSTMAGLATTIVPAGLALLAVLQVAGFGTGWLEVLAAVGVLAGVALRLRAPEPPAGRVDLVAGWRVRVARSAAIQFLDPMLVLPAARPVRARWLRAVRSPVLRLALTGILGRARYLVPCLLLAAAVVFAHRAVPALPIGWLVLIGGYLALVPFGAQLGELHRHAGLRRWLSTRDSTVRIVHAAVLAVIGLLWTTAVLAVGAVALPGLGVLAMPLALLVPVVVAAVVRTAARPLPRYDDLAIVDIGLGQLPVRLVAQSVRGPDIAVLATLVVTGGACWAVALPVSLLLMAFGILR